MRPDAPSDNAPDPQPPVPTPETGARLLTSAPPVKPGNPPIAPQPAPLPPASTMPIVPKFEPPTDSVPDDDEALPPERPIDPTLLLLLLIGVTIFGLSSLTVDARYTLVWTAMIVVGVLTLTLDRLPVEIPTAGDLLLGFGFGAILGFPLLALFSGGLAQTSNAILSNVSPAFAFQAFALIMPAAETLLFRGAVQATRGFLFAALAATVWNLVLFFPQLRVVEFPLVAGVIGAFFVAVNLLYSYLKLRFGLFAAWAAQIAINLLLLFVTRFLV